MAFGLSGNTSQGQGNSSPYIIGRVIHIVMGPNKLDAEGKIRPDQDYIGPADIGKIRFEILYSKLTGVISNTAHEPAYPMFSFIKRLPVIGEIVLILPGPTERLNDRTSRQQFFYFPPYDVWNRVNHSVFPNTQQLTQVENSTANEPGYEGSATTGSVLPLGESFTENPDIRNLLPFEGDTIIQSRFGQSIRFGSTVIPDQAKAFSTDEYLSEEETPLKNNWSNSGKNGDPIIVIINSQGERPYPNFVDLIEDINKDGSSIYMTSTQEIFLEDISNFPLNSFGPTNLGVLSNFIPRPVEIEYMPTSNETLSAADQDRTALS